MILFHFAGKPYLCILQTQFELTMDDLYLSKINPVLITLRLQK